MQASHTVEASKKQSRKPLTTFQYRLPRGRLLRFGLSFVLFFMTFVILAYLFSGESTQGRFPTVVSVILRNGIAYCLLSLGASLVIATSEIDLSSLGCATMSGVIFAIVMSHLYSTGKVFSIIVAIACVVAFSLASGWIVSFCIVHVRAPALIFTWALGSIYIIVAILLTQLASSTVVHSTASVSLPFNVNPSAWAFGGKFFDLSVLMLLAVIVVISGTNLPQRARAIGGNANSASYAGVSKIRTLRMCFLVNALLAGGAGIFQALRTGAAATTDLNVSINGLTPIAIALIGGTSLSGGYLSLWSVLFAALFWSAASLLGPILPVFKSIEAEMGQGLFYFIFLIIAVGFGRLLAPPIAKIYAQRES